MKVVWYELCSSAKPYMSFQAQKSNFEFYGIDIIADEDMNCWLIEVNR
jgi:hypothetical protein